MKRARFITPARREFLSAVAYYNGKEPGLGARFAAAVEEATMRALAFPLTGSPASQNTRRVFIKDFLSRSSTVPISTVSSSSQLRTILVGQNTGNCASKIANKLLEPTRETHATQQCRQNDRVWKLEVDRRSHQQSSGRSRSAASASSQGAMPS